MLAFLIQKNQKKQSFSELCIFVKKLIRIIPLDAIVIACNTASTVVLPPLREQFSIPIVGTVPAIKPAAEISQTKHIGLWQQRARLNALMLMILFISLPPIV